MKSQMKSKRGAFEMSITTIVILVIAMIMLILGIMLVRKIMCGGMNIAEETLQGAKSQISKLFGEQGGEIRCIGAIGGALPTIVPGKPAAIACTYTPEQLTTYNFKIISATFTPVGTTTGTNVMNWFVSTSSTKTVSAGSTDVGGVTIRPPRGVSAGTLIVVVSITVNRQQQPSETYTDTLNFDVRTLGFLRESVC